MADAVASPAQSTLPKRAFAIIFCSSVATAIGNTGLISVLPLIGRSLAIPDEMVVAIFSLSAILWACSSPFWARASDRYGRKPLMMVGLSGFMISMTVCGAVVSAGLRQMAAPMVIFGLLLLGRSLFGLFGAASNPANQAYVADHTPREQRTQAMASLAGAFGLGTVFGPWLAPYFIYPVVGLAGPLFTFAAIAAAMLFVVWRFLPESPRRAETPEEAAEAAAEQTVEKARPMWRDPRVMPFALYGFVVATCQTAQQQTIGFLVIDKLGVSPLAAKESIATAMAFGALAGLLAQWGLIRMFEMTPKQLLRWGVVCGAVGNLLVAIAPDYHTVVAGYALASLGFGFARPGFTAGSSLAVGWKDQARVAGAIAAVNGINAVFAPAFMALYRANHAAPFLLNMVLMLGLLVYAFASRALRNADPAAVTREETTMATIERSDEGGV
ncbi:MAG TPA: MFS transporter [Phenylobacterium sp.]|jgi:MFS family permease|uniref:MFS transporter n=1 Tax=Phenylobacterium sp. TaxID=1871053 RepID=UPI002C0E7FC3|nr:MFS transporter [Phenylobacterium sp.]HXA40395.1 MFS transporter [Phenylobacterium sp.]